jgi:hypothetical protein
MEQNEGRQIGGIVEADETFIGGQVRQSDRVKSREDHPDALRTIKERAVVVAAVERRKDGRLRATVVPDRTHALKTVREFVLPAR